MSSHDFFGLRDWCWGALAVFLALALCEAVAQENERNGNIESRGAADFPDWQACKDAARIACESAFLDRHASSLEGARDDNRGRPWVRNCLGSTFQASCAPLYRRGARTGSIPIADSVSAFEYGPVPEYGAYTWCRDAAFIRCRERHPERSAERYECTKPKNHALYCELCPVDFNRDFGSVCPAPEVSISPAKPPPITMRDRICWPRSTEADTADPDCACTDALDAFLNERGQARNRLRELRQDLAGVERAVDRVSRASEEMEQAARELELGCRIREVSEKLIAEVLKSYGGRLFTVATGARAPRGVELVASTSEDIRRCVASIESLSDEARAESDRVNVRVREQLMAAMARSRKRIDEFDLTVNRASDHFKQLQSPRCLDVLRSRYISERF